MHVCLVSFRLGYFFADSGFLFVTAGQQDKTGFLYMVGEFCGIDVPGIHGRFRRDYDCLCGQAEKGWTSG